MFLDCHEAEKHQLSKKVELLGVDATQYLYHFSCELERSLLEFDPFPRRV